VEELDLGAQDRSRLLRLLAALCLDVLQPHAGSLPGELALAALAIGQAGDLHAVALAGVQGDRAAGAPDEVAGRGGDHQPGFALCCHGHSLRDAQAAARAAGRREASASCGKAMPSNSARAVRSRPARSITGCSGVPPTAMRTLNSPVGCSMLKV